MSAAKLLVLATVSQIQVEINNNLIYVKNHIIQFSTESVTDLVSDQAKQ